MTTWAIYEVNTNKIIYGSITINYNQKFKMPFCFFPGQIRTNWRTPLARKKLITWKFDRDIWFDWNVILLLLFLFFQVRPIVTKYDLYN